MSHHPRVTEWATTIQTHLPHLSKPQIMVLALWSLGMVLARSCALTAVSTCLAPWLHCKDNTVRQRLREFCYEAPAKRGKARQAVVVETKARADIDTEETQAKATAAASWCQHASEYATEVGAKPWKYLLAPHDEIVESKRLSDFLRFEIEAR